MLYVHLTHFKIKRNIMQSKIISCWPKGLDLVNCNIYFVLSNLPFINKEANKLKNTFFWKSTLTFWIKLYPVKAIYRCDQYNVVERK